MIAAVEKAIYVKLNGTSAVTTLLSSATAIYNKQAPTDAVLPYIVYVHAAGGDENESPLDSGDLRYYVQAVAKSASLAASIAGAVRGALHRPSSMAFDAPWNLVQCQAKEVISRVENVDKVQYHYAGNMYRIQISQ